MANTRGAAASNAKPSAKSSDSKRGSKTGGTPKNLKKDADIKDAKKRSVKSASKNPASASKKPSTPVRVQVLTPPTTPRKSGVKRKPPKNREPSTPSPSPKKSKVRQDEDEDEDEDEDKPAIRKKSSKNTRGSVAGSKPDARRHKKGDEVGVESDIPRTSIPSPNKDETLVSDWMSNFMKKSYRKLPKLLGADVDHTSQHKSIEFWSPESVFKMNREINRQLYHAALTFSQTGRFFNLSRADPQHLTVKGDTLLYINPNASTNIAYCVTTIVVDKCHLVEPTNFGNSTTRQVKSISGYPDHFEWNREEAALYMIYSVKDYALRVYEKCLQFTTLPSAESENDGGTLKKFVKTGRSSKSISTLDDKDRRSLLRSQAGMKREDTSGKGNRALSCSDKVPIYDGRNSGVELFDNLANLEANLTECDQDLQFGDVAAVVYTVNKYVASTGSLFLNFNVHSVILIGSPGDTAPGSRDASVDTGAPLLPPFHFASNVTRHRAFLENLEVEEVNDSELQSMDEGHEVDSADDIDLISEGGWSESGDDLKADQEDDSEDVSQSDELEE